MSALPGRSQVRPPLRRAPHRDLNGFETDLHRPEHPLAAEVDGYEFHRTREQFEEDRRRGMGHAAAGCAVVRVGASQVMRAPPIR